MQRRFAVFGLNGGVPWRKDAATTGSVDLQGAEVLKIPIDRVSVPLRMKPCALASRRSRYRCSTDR